MDRPTGSAPSWSCASCGRRLIVFDPPIDVVIVCCDDPSCQQAMKPQRERAAGLRDVVLLDPVDAAFAGIDVI
jgi:hypothetical protein